MIFALVHKEEHRRTDMYLFTIGQQKRILAAEDEGGTISNPNSILEDTGAVNRKGSVF